MLSMKWIAAAASIMIALAVGVAPAQAQPVNIWLTTGDQKIIMYPQPPVTFTAGAAPELPAIFLDDNARYQTIEGFGASMTDSAAYLMNQKIPAEALPRTMQLLFDRTQGIGVSFLRNPMGASDLSRTAYSYDDRKPGETDPELTTFSIDHDRADILPLLRQAKAINPELKLMGSPWSPPGWMKTSGSMIGGRLLASAFPAFANYFVKYLQAYAEAGVPVDYISLQNEPKFVPKDYPGMDLPAPEAAILLRDHVLPALAANKLTAKVLVYDHNWDDPGYPTTVLDEPALANSSQIAGVAWHWYGGTPGAMTTLHNLYPGKSNLVTEASGGTWIGNPVKTDFEMITHSLRNWSTAYIKWGLALDEKRGPHYGGCDTCTALITVDGRTGLMSPTIDYYTLGHFSKFVLPGAIRLWSNNAPGLINAAFVNPNGSRALVVYNDSAESRRFQVVSNGRSFGYILPALAGATFTWSEPSRNSRSTKEDKGTRSSGVARNGTYHINATAQRILASSYTGLSNLQTEQTTDVDGGFDAGFASNGSWAEFRNIDFGLSVRSIEVRVASGGEGGVLEFHLDGVSGPLIAEAKIPVTGGWQNWQTVTTKVSGATGEHDLYVVFSGRAGNGGIGNLNWFQFK